MKRLIILACLFLMLSCCENKHETVVLSDYEVINSWIADNMEQYYLWNDQIDMQGENRGESPSHFFAKAIIPGDKCSYIVSNFKPLLSELSDNRKPGYSYFLYSTGGDAVKGKITYIIKNSPADEAGLKRGMIFTKINGTSLSVHNYNDLIARTVCEHALTVQDSDNPETVYNVPVAEFAENPVFLDTVYSLAGGKTGYLIYNSFTSDNGDLSKEYDMQLNDVFEKFKKENINELLLDLRYNQKGNIFSSMILASMIVPAQNTGGIYAKYQYNKSLQANILSRFGDDYLNLYFADMLKDKTLNNIGDNLNRVFILTSPKTGAIGEILINGLKPFVNVVIVGNKTAGNNIFSLFLYEEDPEKQRINTWAIVPAVMRISNRTGNTDYAFEPDIKITEPLYDSIPLGNTNETVLSAALNVISGKPARTLNSTSSDMIPQKLPLNSLHNLSTNRIPCK
ncbi:MAG: hypothetical protein LBQ01_02095 [Prevotellaceae bacterium]|jgi:C-terminal processing protease CtpA/Prc|nr:hypothetical protein [Prevotellaceae bacterium]